MTPNSPAGSAPGEDALRDIPEGYGLDEYQTPEQWWEAAAERTATERDALARMVGEMSAELALMAIRCNSLLDQGDEAWQRILDDANNRAEAALAAQPGERS